MAKKQNFKSSVVLELGSDWLKLASMVPSGDGLAIDKLSIKKSGTDINTSGAALSGAWKELKLCKQKPITIIPRQMVNIRILDLPSTDPAEIADMIELQAGKQTPYSKDEIVYDFRILNSDNVGYSKVMLAIVQRHALREKYYILEEAGLEASRMTVSTEALLNCFLADPGIAGGGTVAVLDIDSYYTDFVVFGEGELLFSRSILLGANQLTTEFDEYADKFVKEIRTSIESCKNEKKGTTISRIVITGAGAGIGGMEEKIGQELGIVCKRNDAAKILKKTVDSQQNKTVSITALIGAGLNPDNLEYNLVPGSVNIRKTLMEKAFNLSWLGILIMSILLSISLVGSIKLFIKRGKFNELRNEYKKMEAQEIEAKKMIEALSLVKSYRNPQSSVINILHAAKTSAPEGVKFDNIEIDCSTEKIRIDGMALAPKDVRAYVKALEQSEYFSDVKESSSSFDKAYNMTKFQIMAAMEKKP